MASRRQRDFLVFWVFLDLSVFNQDRRSTIPTFAHLFWCDSVVKYPPAMQEKQDTWVPSLGRGDPLEEEVATHSSILAGKIPWTEAPSRLESMGWQRARHNLATKPPRYVTSLLAWPPWKIPGCQPCIGPWTFIFQCLFHFVSNSHSRSFYPCVFVCVCVCVCSQIFIFTFMCVCFYDLFPIFILHLS